MRMKYYLRGIGIGVVITTIILTISFHQQEEQTLTDKQIIERAKELGMVDGSSSGNSDYKTISDLMDEATAQENTENTEQSDQKDKVGNTDQTGSSQENTTTDDGSNENQNNSSTEDNKSTEKKTVKITIQGGDSSNAVAQKCENAGLVKDAYAFNKYLISQGYDSILQPGTYTFTVGSSKKEIAKKLISH